MEHFSFSPEPPSVRKTPPAGGGGTKVPEGDWVASRSDDGRSFFLSARQDLFDGSLMEINFPNKGFPRSGEAVTAGD